LSAQRRMLSRKSGLAFVPHLPSLPTPATAYTPTLGVMHNEMNTKLKKELYWVLGAISATVIIGLIIFGNGLFNGRLLDLQLHDKYYIFPKTLFLTAVLFILLLSTYLIRGIYWKLDNRIVNTLLAAIFTLVLVRLINYWNWIYGFVKDHGFYLFDEKTQTEMVSEFTMSHWVLTIIIPITIVTLLTTGYKIIKPRSRV